MHMQRPGHSVDSMPDEQIDSAVAIVGMACRFAGARSPEQYWANLRDGVESVRTLCDEELLAAGVSPATLANAHYVRAGAPLEDMECFDAALFGLSPRDAAIMDPQHRHFLECAWQALEDAGHTPDRFDGAIGVFAGSGHNAYFARNLLTNPKLVRSVGPFLLRHTGNDKDFLTTRLSYLLNLRGPSINVQTACSTSLVAAHMAVQHLLGGECDMAIAGGVSIELPHGQGYVYEEGEILSPDGHCRPFDAESRGTVFGSGAGLVVLRRLRDAIADGDHIHAVIRGSAVNNDGSGKVGYLAPSVDGQASVIAEALDIAGVDARTIGYVEAHGTGTPVGDPIEVAALTEAYRRDTDDIGYCAIGSVKANIGHTDTAAGTASMIKVAMALRHREIPPSLNYTAPNPSCAFAESPFRVNAALRPWHRSADAPRRAGVSSLGVGGTNAHLVMEEAPERACSGPSRSHQLLAISARSSSALDAGTGALAAHLAGDPTIDLADAAYTLNVGRQALTRRRIVVAGDTAEAASLLGGSDKVFTGEALADRGVAFMFCGAGSQYAGMGATLYAAEPVFRAAVDECLAAADNAELRRWLFPSADDAERAAHELERPSVALPLLFTVQVALARLWMSWGVQPRGMIGHSSGEYAAAYMAGVIGLADALRVVSTRGRLFETLPEGGMLSVPLGEAELRPLLPADLSIAAINGASLCIASGAVEAIARLEATLTERGIETRRVRIAVAAHSPMLDPLLDAFRACLATVTLSAPNIPFVSNLTGVWITAAEATDPEYWVRHLRQTVRFTDGLQQLMADANQVLLEVGPGRTMASLARQHSARAKSQPVLNSLRHPDDNVNDTALMLTTLGRLWTLGVTVDWDRFWAGQQRHRLSLPTYCFDRERHWIEPGTVAMQEEPAADEPLERHADIADWFYEPVWRRTAMPVAAIADGPALVVDEGRGLGAALAARLRGAGRIVTVARFGRRFAHSDDAVTIDAARPEDYRRLLADMVARHAWPSQIYHCGLVTHGPGSGTSGEAATLQDHGLYSLLFLVQALGEEDRDTPVRIAMITDGMQRVADEPWIEPAKATVAGACRVVAHEFPTLGARTIDVTTPTIAGAPLHRVADLILAELAGVGDDEAVAYRSGERWVQSFDAAPRADADDDAIELRTGGTYLITGGLGGIALALAKHLAERCGARVALVARTALPTRATWNDLLASRPAGDAVRARILDILGIEAAGGEVLLVQADVADRRAMRRAISQVRARFGDVHGVFHAAGRLDDDVAQLKTRSGVDSVLRPKLFGTLALSAALGRQQPDFMMLFSSISAFAGLVGQVDYAAANAFLDAYAQANRASDAPRIISVGWSQWRDVGMVAARALADTGDSEPDLPGAGRPLDHPFLDALHILSPDDVVVSARLSPDRHWLLDEHRIAGGSALIPGTGYLELVRAAHDAIAAGPVEIGEISFLAPFAVPDGAARDLRIHLTRDGAGWRFAVLGRAIDSADEGWTEHVRGTIGAAPGGASAPAPMDAVRARCTYPAPSPADVEGSPFLRFGARWHNVRRVAFGEAEALVDLALPEQFLGDLGRIALHPALLDFATAGAQALMPGHDPAHTFYAPLSYRRVRLLAPLPAVIVSHIRRSGNTDPDTPLAVFDVTITDATGAVLVEIEGFTMIKVRDPSLLAAPAPASARAGGLATREGLRVIDRILAGAARPHLIVSPEPLVPAIARLRPPPRLAPVSRTAGGEDEAAPRTPTEQMIAEMWGEMLGVDHVRYTDDFFDLGGHSLLAVQFTNRLRKRTGRMLPLAALIETPTVERVASLVDRDGATPVACTSPGTPAAGVDTIATARPDVVVLRAGGTHPALFIVHDGLGETMLYRTLALKLPAGRTIYGLEPERQADGNFAQRSIEAMAAAYVRRIRRVQPDGPYLLAGLCAGGVIAFEMARQLQDAGASVPFVGILDAADVEASARGFYVMRTRLDSLRRTLDLTSAGGVAGAVPIMLRKVANMTRWELTSRIERLRRTRMVSALDTAPADRGSSDAPSLSFLQLYEVAHRAHRPQGLFAGGDVTLFRATQGNGAEDDIPFCEKYSDCILGWGKRAADDVTLVQVPGGHSSLLQMPHVQTLAIELQRAIDQALAKWTDEPGVTRAAAPSPDRQLLDVPLISTVLQ